jgi:hypothetical protein
MLSELDSTGEEKVRQRSNDSRAVVTALRNMGLGMVTKKPNQEITGGEKNDWS